MNLIRAFLCWRRSGGHLWNFLSMSVIKTPTGKSAEIMKCVHCGSETTRKKA